MATVLYDAGAAAGYDRFFGHVSRHFVPPLLRAARLAHGQRVLEVATGTGIATEAAAAAVGPSGRVVASDISPAMLEGARRRLGGLPNVSLTVEDGQSLTLPDESFDAVFCHLGLMFFPDPAKGVSEFARVLRRGGRAAVSVNAPERAYFTPVVAAIAARSRAGADISKGVLASVGDRARLRGLLEDAGLAEVEVAAEAHRFALPSFDAYFGGVERGEGGAGKEFAALPEEDRRAVREEVRRKLGGGDGPVALEVEIWFGSGRR